MHNCCCYVWEHDLYDNCMLVCELTCWNVHLWVYCVLEQFWWKMRLWCWIVHEFVFISCCWWLLNCWNQNYVTGNVVYGFMRRFVVMLVFWKNFVNLMKWAMLLFLMLESCLFKCIEPVLTHKHFLEVDLGVGGLKIGILGKNGVKTRNFCIISQERR